MTVCLGLTMGMVALAREVETSDEDTPGNEDIIILPEGDTTDDESEGEIIEEVILDETVEAEDLEVSKPRILPDSRIYFLKEWGRSIRSLFTFNKVKKAELESKFANEKLIEIKTMVEKDKKPEAVKKAITKYKKALDKVKSRTEKIKEKAQQNPEVEKFMEKYTHQQVLHQKILEKLEEKVPSETFEKIKEVREKHLESFKNVMLKLEEKDKIAERLEKTLKEQKGSKFKNFKDLELLKKIKEKMPEEVKETITETEGKILKQLKEKLESLPAEEQEKFKKYVDKISGSKEKQLEIVENLRAELKENPVLKEKLLETREKILEKIPIEIKAKKIECPKIEKSSQDFCKDGRIIFKKDEKGCIIDFECIIPGEIEKECRPVCSAIGTKSEGWYDSCNKKLIKYDNCKECKVVCKNIGTKSEGWYNSCNVELIRFGKCMNEDPVGSQPVCYTIWDPVCGKDGKTYSNKCFAKVAGAEIAYKGKCKERECKTDTDCPQPKCGPTETISAKCIGVMTKCINGKCVIVEEKAEE